MERGSVVDAHTDYLDNSLFVIRYYRMHNHYIGCFPYIRRDYDREKREDDYNEKRNIEWMIQLLDQQRI